MSNPAVIILSQVHKVGAIRNIRLEDNIGECIHLHFNEIRFDLSIEELKQLSLIMQKALIELDGENLTLISKDFLLDVYKHTGFKKPIIEEELVNLSKLRFIVRKTFKNYLNLNFIKRIEDTPHYKYLNGDKEPFNKYFQENVIGIDNDKRLKRKNDNFNKIEKTKVVVFGKNSFLIRDGLHRASVLAHRKDKDTKIIVVRIINIMFNKQFSIIWLKNIYSCLKTGLFIFKRLIRSLLEKAKH